MFLALDFGNTRTKAALFAPGETAPREIALFPEGNSQALRDWLDGRPARAGIVSSVGHPDPELDEALRARLGYCLVLSHETPLPIVNRYGTPQTLGRDRLAGAVGAWRLFPGENILVLDAGTCLKYDFVNAAGEYLGGSISPGLGMRFAALRHFTARLPLVEMQRLDDFIGYSTESAIRTGVQLGALYEAEGFLAEYERLFGLERILVTGGDADFFATQLKKPIFAAPHLVLIGLITILEHNVHLSV